MGTQRMKGNEPNCDRDVEHNSHHTVWLGGRGRRATGEQEVSSTTGCTRAARGQGSFVPHSGDHQTQRPMEESAFVAEVCGRGCGGHLHQDGRLVRPLWDILGYPLRKNSKLRDVSVQRQREGHTENVGSLRFLGLIERNSGGGDSGEGGRKCGVTT